MSAEYLVGSIGVLIWTLGIVWLVAFTSRETYQTARKAAIAVMAFFLVCLLFTRPLNFVAAAVIFAMIATVVVAAHLTDVGPARKFVAWLKAKRKSAQFKREGKNENGFYPLVDEEEDEPTKQESSQQKFVIGPNGERLVPINDDGTPIHGDHDGNTKLWALQDYNDDGHNQTERQSRFFQ